MDFKYCKLEIFIPEENFPELQKALQSVDAGTGYSGKGFWNRSIFYVYSGWDGG